MQKYDGIAIHVSKEAASGPAAYSNFCLSIYDFEVLFFEMKYIFQCQSSKILEFYNKYISGTHLDIGVGTGYFLDKCKFPVKNPVVHLMDLNLNSLSKTANRIRRYQPILHHWNVLEPVQEQLPLFSSIGASNFLHCLPGNMLSKEIFFKNLKPYLREGGVFFGLTILGQGVDGGWLYHFTNSIYNKAAIFSNSQDNLADLEKILARNFARYSVNLVGSVAFFTAYK